MEEPIAQQENEREEALRTHLLNNIEASTLAKGPGDTEHGTEANIDPAISSLHVLGSHLTVAAPVAPVAPVGHLSQSHLPDSTDTPGTIQRFPSPQDLAHIEVNDPSRKKSGKRELSTSKRAAQNRAAQRAFRQRKEGYIKKLEEQVRDFGVMEEQYKAIQAENYSLRAYIISLQSRLIESQGEDAVPPPPNHLLGNNQMQSNSKQPVPFENGKGKVFAHQSVPDSAHSSSRQYDGGANSLRETKDDEAYNSFLAKRLNAGDSSDKSN